MSTFASFAGVAVLTLSFGFLVTALLAVKTPNVHLAITGTDAVSLVCANLIVDVEAKINALCTFLMLTYLCFRAWNCSQT